MVAFPANVSVRAASPSTTDKVRPAVSTSALANVTSKAAPVDRTPSAVSPVCVPPLTVGAVSVSPASVVAVAPRETEVEPRVTALKAKFALEMDPASWALVMVPVSNVVGTAPALKVPMLVR